jgi:hypothetical protein
MIEVICERCGDICCVDGEFPKFFAWCYTCGDYADCDWNEYNADFLSSRADEMNE